MPTLNFRTVSIAIAVLTLSACGGGGGGGGGITTAPPPPPPPNEAPMLTTPTAFSFDENQAVEFLVEVTDPDDTVITVTDGLGEDGALFTVNASSGFVTANTPNGAFDFEMPQDANSDNVYEQTIMFSDGTNTITETFTVTILPVDEAPEFTNVTSVNLNENATGALLTFTAFDPEGGSVSDFQITEVSKLGEVVNSERLLQAFAVDEATGELTVLVPFDAEVEGTQDSISVTVGATDGALQGFGSVAISLIDLEGMVTDGVFIRGQGTNNSLGEFTQNIGDIDNDGLPEIWVTETTDQADVEVAYLIWGSTIRDEMVDGFGDLVITDLTADQAIRFTNDVRSQTERRSIVTASAAGDVDGDGQNDLLIGLSEQRDFTFDDAADGPLAYVLWGDQLAAVATGEVDLPSLTPATGIQLTGLSRFENVQLSMTAGDLDGDGRADLLFGSPWRNHARLVYGSALNQGTANLDLSSAGAEQTLLLQSVTESAIQQQLGAHVATLADLDEDGNPDFAISGAGLEPNFNSGVYIVASEIVTNAKGVVSAVNLLDPTLANNVAELQSQDDTIAGLSAGGDIDNDGLNDLAVSYIGFFENTRVASVVYATTLQNALTAANPVSLIASSPADGININFDGQIFSQTNDTNLTAQLIPSVAAGSGSELLIGLSDDSPLNRANAGSIYILNDTSIVSSATATISIPVDDFPADLGRKFAGLAANTRLGGTAFVSDIDNDGMPDLSLASPTLDGQPGGLATGGYVFLPGTIVSGAFATDNAIFDMAMALDNETPP